VPYDRLKLGRAVLVAGLIGLSLAACGRKGPLEAPPNATNAIALPDNQIGGVEEQVGATTQASPFGRPARASREFRIPESRFVLDPLL
jgi:predicted small lipoprotein YifL